MHDLHRQGEPLNLIFTFLLLGPRTSSMLDNKMVGLVGLTPDTSDKISPEDRRLPDGPGPWVHLWPVVLIRKRSFGQHRVRGDLAPCGLPVVNGLDGIDVHPPDEVDSHASCRVLPPRPFYWRIESQSHSELARKMSFRELVRYRQAKYRRGITVHNELAGQDDPVGVRLVDPFRSGFPVAIKVYVFEGFRMDMVGDARRKHRKCAEQIRGRSRESAS